MTTLHRRATFVAAILLLGGAACGDRDGPGLLGGDDADIEPGGRAVIAETADINHPLSLLFMSSVDGNLAADVMNMELLRGEWRDGQLGYMTADESPMALARRFEYVGPDSAALRFHMRSDVRWSDGTPLTAHDVAFTYSLAANPALNSPRMDYVEHIDSVVANNDSVVTFHFGRRHANMLTHTTIAPIPRHVYQDADPAQLRNHRTITSPAGNLVVSGPFMIGQHERGQRIVLVRNPHFQPAAHLDEIVIRIIPEATTRLVELQTGAVDFVQNVSFDQIPRLRQQAPHIRWETEEKRTYDYIAYHPAGFAPFADPEIRRALSMAIDTRALIAGLQMEEFAVPAGGPYPPIFADLYDEREAPPVPFAPDEARRILASKGWTDSGSDGILRRNGQPFRFTLLTNAGNQRRADATQIIQQQWRQIGVDAQLRTLEFNTFMAALTGDDYQAALGGWVVNLSPDLTQMWAADSPFNITRYRNAEVSRLFEQALAQPTQEAARPLWRRAAATLARDQPYTWLYFFDSVDAVNERLRGVKVDSYGPYQNTWEWWIPADRRRGGAPTAARADPRTENSGN
jgi:peptide/nickel transport system substrate-binding protein